jgi:signal transduction histidine kinase/CheY-like chemotaxis protein
MKRPKILSIGTVGILDEEVVNRIVITNILSLTFAVAMLIVGPFVFHYFGWKPGIGIPFVLEFFLNALVPYLNWRRKYTAACLVLYYLQCLAIGWFGYQFGQLLQLQFTIVFLVYINYLIFKDRKLRYLGIVAALFDLAILEVSYYRDIGHGGPYIVHFLVMAAVVAISGLLSQFYMKSNDLRYRLAKANSLIKIFLAQVTHELRNSLESIHQSNQQLRKEVQSDRTLHRISEFVNASYIASTTARDVIGNVLDLSRIEAGQEPKPILQPLAVKSFLDKMIEVHRFIAREQEMRLLLKVDKKMPDVILTDPLLISQVLNNLLNNAIKYSTKATTVNIDITAHEDTWQIGVNNTGPVIPREKIGYIFDPFVTLGTGEKQGTGLGLYIVKKKVEAMNGKVTVQSDPPGLTTFVVSLPLTVVMRDAANPGILDEPSRDEIVDMNDIHVLMAEDQQLTAFILDKSLKQLGCRVTAVKNGLELLNAAQKKHNGGHPFDLIIMDCHMPVMDGEETIGHLKRDPALSNIPIIVTTGDIFPDTLNRMIAVGADAWLKKPFDDGTLKEAISRQLMRRKQHG